MGDSGDIEILEKQVSLLRDLLGRLDRGRAERRGGPGDSFSSKPAPASEAGANPSDDAGAALRLVREETHGGSGDGSGWSEKRKPRFREKRSWNLSEPGPETPRRPAPELDPVQSVGRPVAGPGGAERESVPLQLYDQLLRDRDDLLVQVMRHHNAEQRLQEERAAAEGKDQEIRRLREELRSRQSAHFEELFGRLYQRLVEVEDLERVLVQRAIDMSPASTPAGAPETSVEHAAGRPEEKGERTEMPSVEPSGKKLLIRGHEIIITTSQDSGAGYYSFALLTLDAGGKDAMKGFKATARASRDSELQCIGAVLDYLEAQSGAGSRGGKLISSRNLARIRGREVDIFCDTVGPGNFQAFPFLYDASGGRHIILRFHLDEAVTADSPEEARLRCVRRLESYFDEQDAESPG